MASSSQPLNSWYQELHCHQLLKASVSWSRTSEITLKTDAFYPLKKPIIKLA